MTGIISFNPVVTTNAAGSFNIGSDGNIQGTAYDDPATRFALTGGVLAASETLPMWGGCGISEDIASTVTNGAAPERLVGRATSLTNLTGFSVFDQNHAAVTSPQSPVPLAGSLMSVNFYRLGSSARLAVACDPSLVSLDGGLVTQQVSWDFGGQFLAPYVASYPANVVTNMTYSSTTGLVTLTTTSAHGVAVGDDFDLSGFTNTGVSLNGTWLATTGTTGSTLIFAISATPGTVSVYGSLLAGGGALACKVLAVHIGNSMTVSYNPTTGFATWNRGGSTAIIQI